MRRKLYDDGENIWSLTHYMSGGGSGGGEGGVNVEEVGEVELVCTVAVREEEGGGEGVTGGGEEGAEEGACQEVPGQGEGGVKCDHLDSGGGGGEG